MTRQILNLLRIQRDMVETVQAVTTHMLRRPCPLLSARIAYQDARSWSTASLRPTWTRRQARLVQDYRALYRKGVA